MNSGKKRNIFLAVTAVLVIALIAIMAVIAVRGPRTSPVEVVSKGTEDGTLIIDDINDGKMTIPKYDIPTSSYEADKFSEKNGVITYENGSSAIGVNVNEQYGDIDWEKVKESGVDFAMIRVGYRGKDTGPIMPDSKFEENMKGAKEAGLDIGVYFFSQAVSDAEAEEEAGFVLQQIQSYQLTYPVAYDWEYVAEKNGKAARTANCTGEQITGFVDTFCKKVSKAGRKACFYSDKAMGYEKLNLSRLSGYDMWYAEYRKTPSFYYDFKMWQYTKEGSVSGIDGSVPVTIALKAYG